MSVIITPDERRNFKVNWVAGVRGKPGLNADILNTSEAVREIADPSFELQGTNMTSALCTHRAEGGILLTTAGADNDQFFLLGHQDASQSGWVNQWNTDFDPEWECLIKTGSAVTTVVYLAGWKSDIDAGINDADLCMFKFNTDDSDTNWQFLGNEASVDVVTDTGVAVTADTTYHLALRSGHDKVVRAYINGDCVGAQSFASGNEAFRALVIGQQLAGSITRELIVYGIKASTRYGVGA